MSKVGNSHNWWVEKLVSDQWDQWDHWDAGHGQPACQAMPALQQIQNLVIFESKAIESNQNQGNWTTEHN